MSKGNVFQRYLEEAAGKKGYLQTSPIREENDSMEAFDTAHTNHLPTYIGEMKSIAADHKAAHDFHKAARDKYPKGHPSYTVHHEYMKHHAANGKDALRAAKWAAQELKARKAAGDKDLRVDKDFD